MKKCLFLFFVMSVVLSACDNETVNIPKDASSIIISPEELFMYSGGSESFSATFNTGEPCSPIWHSSNESVASIDSVSGIITAYKQGTTNITAKIATQKTTLKSNICKVIVEDDAVLLSDNNVSIFVGDSYVLQAHLKSDKKETCAFSSSDSQIATVNEEGCITAIGVGNCTITVTMGNLSAFCQVIVKESQGSENGHDWVDLGLSVRWATMNIFAIAPQWPGALYAWAEIDSRYEFSWQNYKWALFGPYIADGVFYPAGITKYQYPDNFKNAIYYRVDTIITQEEDGFTRVTYDYVFIGDGKTRIEKEDDVANYKWGGLWRIPTKDECQELIDNCNWEWLVLNGVEGCKVTSRKNNKWIFLPGNVTYWTSDMPGLSEHAYYLEFNVRGEHSVSQYSKYVGRAIRAVIE